MLTARWKIPCIEKEKCGCSGKKSSIMMSI